MSRSTRSFVVGLCRPPRRTACLTVSGLGLTVGVILLAYLAFAEEERTSSLQLVSVIFRHGDRTPTETYPTDPYAGDSTWPEGWGQLTKKGKQQLYSLGQYLRSKYDGFVSDLYLINEVYVTSSPRDRCLMSAEVCLAGLYPPKESQVWNPAISWQPIPVHSAPREVDQLILVTKPCPRYNQELSKAYSSPEIQKINEENAELYEYLRNHTGQSTDNITAVEFLFNTLEIEEQNGLILPEWTKSVYPGKMKKLAALSLAIFTHTEQMKRLKGGPLVREITKYMDAKRNGTLNPNRKLFLYSAHDITLVNIWRTLGFTELIKPEYGAMLMLELHKSKSDQHEVKLLYRNNTSTEKEVTLDIPGCPKPCYLDTFLEVTSSIVPDDWEHECQL